MNLIFKSLHDIHLIHFSPALPFEYGSTQKRHNQSPLSDDSLTFLDLVFFDCLFTGLEFSTINFVFTFLPTFFSFFNLALLFLNSFSKAIFWRICQNSTSTPFPTLCCFLPSCRLWKRSFIFWSKCFRYLNQDFF